MFVKITVVACALAAAAAAAAAAATDLGAVAAYQSYGASTLAATSEDVYAALRAQPAGSASPYAADDRHDSSAAAANPGYAPINYEYYQADPAANEPAIESAPDLADPRYSHPAPAVNAYPAQPTAPTLNDPADPRYSPHYYQMTSAQPSAAPQLRVAYSPAAEVSHVTYSNPPAGVQYSW